LGEEAGEDVAVGRGEALETGRGEFGGKPLGGTLVEEGKKMAEVALHGGKVVRHLTNVKRGFRRSSCSPEKCEITKNGQFSVVSFVPCCSQTSFSMSAGGGFQWFSMFHLRALAPPFPPRAGAAVARNVAVSLSRAYKRAA
jgi:hypothetical protein